MPSLTFLGTGNYLAPGRYWNSFLIDGTILVEPSPTVLPHLRHCGIRAGDLDAVVISHFHPDHTFGWPFLALELLHSPRTKPLWIVGPPGVDAFLAEMMALGSVADIHEQHRARDDTHFVDVTGDGGWQQAGPLRFRAVEVQHVPDLRCFGYLFDRGGRMIAYSGDTRPCDGLEELVGAAGAVVLECNGPHEPKTHMDVDDVRALRARHPAVPFILTHLGEGIDASGIPEVTVPSDFETLQLPSL
ncbi:MAG TPA: ribonuclease Z [Acidimicrobiales bacterium]|nr:ribonuclease Z [Acidimicrobiales bacterium]